MMKLRKMLEESGQIVYDIRKSICAHKMCGH